MQVIGSTTRYRPCFHQVRDISLTALDSCIVSDSTPFFCVERNVGMNYYLRVYCNYSVQIMTLYSGLVFSPTVIPTPVCSYSDNCSVFYRKRVQIVVKHEHTFK
jgi:hypothetical protein